MDVIAVRIRKPASLRAETAADSSSILAKASRADVA